MNISKNLKIDVNTSEEILTPFSCASLVNEVLKCIIYQKSQIPYPYSWLKTIVNKKRKKVEDEADEKEEKKTINTFKLDNYFRVVSTLYDNMEFIMDNINKEFVDGNSRIKEILIVFGVTPFCPKEIFSIRINNFIGGHLERNHHIDATRKQQKILRHIFLSQIWMDSIDSSLNCTNTYVFIKKDIPGTNNEINKDCFLPTQPPCFSDKVKKTVINFNWDEKSHLSCCDYLAVFGEDAALGTELLKKKQINNSNDFVEIWCQSKVQLQGFKDCFIDKVPVHELW